MAKFVQASIFGHKTSDSLTLSDLHLHVIDMPASVNSLVLDLKVFVVVFLLMDVALRVYVRGIHFEFKSALFGVQISLLEAVFMLGTETLSY